MRQKKRRVSITSVEIKTLALSVRNSQPKRFMEQCNRIPLLGYHVETLADGSKICITKPGAKSFVDFQVWVVRPNGEAWRPSHGEIYDDIQAKYNENPGAGRQVIAALRKVHDGEEPDDAMKTLPDNVELLPGYPVDLILKTYKWIFAQEDCNHPPPRFEGRSMAMKGIEKIASP